MMRRLRLICRLLGTFILGLLLILMVPLVRGLIHLFSPDAAHRFVFRISRPVGRILVRLYGIRIRVIGAEQIPRKHGFIVVGNHVGYAELISLISRIPAVFVAKEEVKSWPFLGRVFQVGGEVFVDRDSGGRSGEYAATVEQALAKHINIFFSPEGTTSDGTILRRFKSPLFVPADRLKRPVLPFAFYPEKIEGRPVTSGNRDLILWHSDMSFTPHFTRFLMLKSVHVVLSFGDAIVPDLQDDSLSERRRFAALMRSSVDALYRPLNPDYTGREE